MHIKKKKHLGTRQKNDQTVEEETVAIDRDRGCRLGR